MRLEDIDRSIRLGAPLARLTGETSAKFGLMPQIATIGDRNPMTYFMADYVIRAVSTVFGVSQVDLRGDRRIWAVSHPRQMAMYVCLQKCPHLSMRQIGRILGGRDRTTVLHGIRAAEKRFQSDPDWPIYYQKILHKLARMGVA